MLEVNYSWTDINEFIIGFIIDHENNDTVFKEIQGNIVIIFVKIEATVSIHFIQGSRLYLGNL